MKNLILLYLGTVLLMYLSQVCYPRELPSPDRGKIFMWQRADIFMVIAIAWLTCFSFLRTSYNDTYTYIWMYDNAETAQEFIDNGGLLDLTGNPLSYFYQSFMHDLTDNYHIYFFFPAFMSSFAVIKLFKQYSVSPGMSVLIFFSIGTYMMYVAALKQCLAMFFLLWSLPYAIDKKYVRFYILVFMAILFHTHAFMFAIVPFLLEKPWGKVTWAGLVFTLFAMATYKFTLGKFMEWAQSLGAFVSEEEIFDGHQINVLRVVVYWVPVLFALLFRQRLFQDSTKVENLFTNMSIVGAFILTIGVVEGANLYARMAGYFEVATAVTLPWMIKKVFNKQSAQLVTLAAGICYFGYFMFEFGVSKSFGSQYAAITIWEFLSSLFS